MDQKLTAWEAIDSAEASERDARAHLEEILASGDYGLLTKGDIIKAMQKIHAATQHHDAALHHLDKSMEFLEGVLDTLESADSD